MTSMRGRLLRANVTQPMGVMIAPATIMPAPVQMAQLVPWLVDLQLT
jgi:hypothetical protein